MLKRAFTIATGAVAPFTIAADRRLGGQLPTGTEFSLSEAARRTGGRSVRVRESEDLGPERPRGIPSGLALTDRADVDVVRAVVGAELPCGRVLGRERVVVDASGNLVWQLSHYFGTQRPRQHPVFLRLSARPPHRVRGRLGVLACQGDSNYYHFLLDVLPRVELIRKSGLAAPDAWYSPAATAFQRELLRAFGIHDVIDADKHPHVTADVLLVTDTASTNASKPPWVVEFLRRSLLPDGKPSARRPIYVTRGSEAHNRAVRNEDALILHLRRRGFDVVDPGRLSVADQISVFSAAPLIVGAHGAALTNVVFAPVGAALVELFPSGAVLPDFWRLTQGVPGMRYRYLSPSAAPRRPSRERALVSDIVVDFELLDVVLDELATDA